MIQRWFVTSMLVLVGAGSVIPRAEAGGTQGPSVIVRESKGTRKAIGAVRDGFIWGATAKGKLKKVGTMPVFGNRDGEIGAKITVNKGTIVRIHLLRDVDLAHHTTLQRSRRVTDAKLVSLVEGPPTVRLADLALDPLYKNPGDENLEVDARLLAAASRAPGLAAHWREALRKGDLTSMTKIAYLSLQNNPAEEALQFYTPAGTFIDVTHTPDGPYVARSTVVVNSNTALKTKRVTVTNRAGVKNPTAP